jgi:hypothetical protein
MGSSQACIQEEIHVVILRLAEIHRECFEAPNLKLGYRKEVTWPRQQTRSNMTKGYMGVIAVIFAGISIFNPTYFMVSTGKSLCRKR